MRAWFSAAMTPPDAAAALAGVEILKSEPERVTACSRTLRYSAHA
jgi:7-keto-8-aminopelargonate synthetase-like enzyme